jgi:F-type H+-transporting ATPase subunit gamma
MISLRVILRKVKAYEKYKDITKSIQLVALSNIAELKDQINSRFLSITPFLVFFNVESYSECRQLNCLVMPITVDKNCCGPHNKEVFDSANKLIESLEDKENTVKLFTTGKKSKNYFMSHYPGYVIKNVERFSRDIGTLSIFSCSVIVEKMTKKKIGCDRYYFLFRRYINIFKQEVSSYEFVSFIEFLSLLVDYSSSNEGLFHRVMLDYKDNINYLNDFYLFSISLLLMDSLEENEYSSLGSRIVAMDSSKKNAAKLVDILTLIYNKVRQEYITTELTEIVSCANFI